MKFINAALFALAAHLASAVDPPTEPPNAQKPINPTGDDMITVSIDQAESLTSTYTSYNDKLDFDNQGGGGPLVTFSSSRLQNMMGQIDETFQVDQPNVFVTIHNMNEPALKDGAEWGTGYQDPTAVTVKCHMGTNGRLAMHTNSEGLKIAGAQHISSSESTIQPLQFLETEGELKRFFGIDEQATDILVDVCGAEKRTSVGIAAKTRVCLTAVAHVITPNVEAYPNVQKWLDIEVADGIYRVIEQTCFEVDVNYDMVLGTARIIAKPREHATVKITGEISITPELHLNFCEGHHVDASTSTVPQLNWGETVCMRLDVYGIPDSIQWACRSGEGPYATDSFIQIKSKPSPEEQMCKDSLRVVLSQGEHSTSPCTVNEMAYSADLEVLATTCYARTLYYYALMSETTAPALEMSGTTESSTGNTHAFGGIVLVRLPAREIAADSSSVEITLTILAGDGVSNGGWVNYGPSKPDGSEDGAEELPDLP